MLIDGARPATRPAARRAEPRSGVSAPRRPERSATLLGGLPLLSLVVALGVLAVALGNADAREGGGGEVLFWAGLALIYGPVSLRLFSRGASREERIGLVILLGLALYLVKVLHSPLEFTLHDEAASWRETTEVLISGHLFAINPIVPDYGVYPTLTAVTAAVSSLSGLSVFDSALVLIGITRILFMVAIFRVLELATRSAWAAGIGTAIYAANPSFLYFDSQFAYESIALLIAAAMLIAVMRWTEAERRADARTAYLPAFALLAAGLAVTHHMSSYALIAFLGLWAGAELLSRRFSGGPPPSLRHGPALPAIMLAAATALWFGFVAAGHTTSELLGVFVDAGRSLSNLAFGGAGPKALFDSGSGAVDSTAFRLIGLASVGTLLALLPFALWRIWKQRRQSPLALSLGFVAMLYPATLVPRLTAEGSEISQRASEFIFIGLGFALGILFVEVIRGTGARQRLLRLALPVLMTIVFLGGIVIGEAPSTRQPGPYLVAAESRSISPQGLDAARWVADHLPEGSRVIVDRPNGQLLGSIGRLEPVVGGVGGVTVSQVFESPTFDAADQKLISEDEIDYIVRDLRLATDLPVAGYYFSRDEPRAGEWERPISRAGLRKFDFADGLSRVYTNGSIAIYDTSGRRER